MARKDSKDEKFKQNKIHYESTVIVGKSLLEFILMIVHNSDQGRTSFKDKLAFSNTQLKKAFNKDEVALLESGVDPYNLDKLDLSFLHKLVYHICELDKSGAPDLQKHLHTLKENRNDIAHMPDITKVTDLFIWLKIEELRDLFQTILNGIKDFYQTDIVAKNKEMNDKLDEILKNIIVEVTDSEVKPFLEELQAVGPGKCPFEVMIEIKSYPSQCSNLMPLLERLGQENTKVRLLVVKAFFDDLELMYYDSWKYLSPLLDKNSRCKLTWYRGNLSNEMIKLLPASLKQLYIRMRSDQVQHLNRQLPELLQLWNLVLFLDFSTPAGSMYGVNMIDPSSLPQLNYKGKQLGLKVCACITTARIPWIVEVIKRFTQGHQIDTLEFYQTRLNTGNEVEDLLKQMNEADIHVTTWVKLQNEEQKKDTAEEKRLSILARKHNLRMFKFLRAW